MGISISDTMSASSLRMPDAFTLEPDLEPVKLWNLACEGAWNHQAAERNARRSLDSSGSPTSHTFLFVLLLFFGSMVFYSFQDAQSSFSVFASWTCSN